jgi:hypothetical protein
VLEAVAVHLQTVRCRGGKLEPVAATTASPIVMDVKAVLAEAVTACRCELPRRERDRALSEAVRGATPRPFGMAGTTRPRASPARPPRSINPTLVHLAAVLETASEYVAGERLNLPRSTMRKSKERATGETA